MKKIISCILICSFMITLSTAVFATDLQCDSIPVLDETAAAFFFCNEVDVTGATIKTLMDLNGDTFMLIETGENGFYIYDVQGSKYLELSDDAKSPYYGYDKNLYYFGPLCYYVKSGETYTHTITGDKITSGAAQMGSYQFSNLLEENTKNAEITLVSSNIVSLSSNSYIPSYAYIRYAAFPENTDGTCGYVAACLVLYYWHKVKKCSIIPSQFLDEDGQLSTKSGNLQDKLLGYGYSSSTWALVIRNVLRDFCSEYGISATSSYSLLNTGIASEIANGRPVIAFGLFPSSPSQASLYEEDFTIEPLGNITHAVTVYGTNGSYYICHYGWTGYSHVLLDGGLIGSCTFFQVN